MFNTGREKTEAPLISIARRSIIIVRIAEDRCTTNALKPRADISGILATRFERRCVECCIRIWDHTLIACVDIRVLFAKLDSHIVQWRSRRSIASSVGRSYTT